MPGWHRDTELLQREGRPQMLGIIQEQHPDRCRLFMQWKQMEWPILVDSLNLTGIEVVPVTYALDEHGVVRYVNPTRQDLQQFVQATYQPPAAPPAAVPGPWQETGIQAFWRGNIDDALVAFHAALKEYADSSVTHFRLGVLYRARYDSSQRQAGDFARAIEHWTRALELNPNQYIYRRRLQQYGPRLTKPYPFYDWVLQARQDIAARGETPVPLSIEPGGAELAAPARRFEADLSELVEPNARGRITRDTRGFVHVETTIVPPSVKPGETARVHLVFRPNSAIKAHWNNEVEGLQVWVAPPDGWASDARLIRLPNPPEEVSSEVREVQFELRVPDGTAGGRVEVAAYALYYVCEDVNGTCLYRRRDLTIPITIP